MWAVLLPIIFAVEAAGQGCAAGSEVCEPSRQRSLLQKQSKSDSLGKVPAEHEAAGAEAPSAPHPASMLSGRSAAPSACVDKDKKIAKLAVKYGVSGVSGCIDVAGLCAAKTKLGMMVQKLCCATCTTSDVPETSLPPPSEGDAVHLFLLGGQSECVGEASAEMLAEDGQATYSELVGSQEGVWFAGYSSPAASDRFFIANMKAGNEKASGFGPEVSFGQTVRNLTGARVLVVKYCMGGSSVKTHWNPSTAKNSWDSTEDDGTADFLLKSGGVDFADKGALFVTWIYTARRAAEALTAAGVDFKWKGIVWVQGMADASSTWEEFGNDTARVWMAARAALGTPDLPIVDTGSTARHGLRRGKDYAGQLVGDSTVRTLEWASATANPSSDCTPTVRDPCLEDIIFNNQFFNFFGWDPLFPAELKGKKANDKTFHWFKNVEQGNLHSEYEGMVALGRMLADGYVEFFTDKEVPERMMYLDPSIKFPWHQCEGSATPTRKNHCWMAQ